jgi:hypothetical protein
VNTPDIMPYIGARRPCDDCGAESDVDVFIRFTAYSDAGRDALAEVGEVPRVGHLCAAHARVAVGASEKA